MTGSLIKTNSPYQVNATIEVPQGKTLLVEPGVELRFAESANLNVYGSIQARGTKTDSIFFTAQDTAHGWKGIHLFKNEAQADSNLFEYCVFSHSYQIDQDWRTDFGAFLLDTVNNVRFGHSTFTRNICFGGACISARKSTTMIGNCRFEKNQALDTSKVPPTDAPGPYSSVIWAINSYFDIQGCTFKGNTSTAPFYPKAGIPDEEKARSLMVFNGKKVRISNCEFTGNHVDDEELVSYKGSVQQTEKEDSFFMDNCLFKGNTMYNGAILYLDSDAANYIRVFVNNCDFIENECFSDARGSVIACYNNNGGANHMYINNCRLIDNKTLWGLSSIDNTTARLSNSIITGQRGLGVFANRTIYTDIVNCLIVNNWVGIESAFEADLNVVSSLVAYNGRIDTTPPYPGGDAFYFSTGVYIGDRGKINLHNSIISNNRGHLGQMSNIVGINRSLFGGQLHNCILEGGIDSTYRQPISEPWIRTDTMLFTSIKNVYNSTPNFTKPPTGVGVNYSGEASDFHVKETCDSSIIFDKGYKVIGVPFDFWPNQSDLDGNPRTQCRTMDIGPYEQKGPKGYTFLEKPWNDATLCSDDVMAFNPLICGHTVDYTWQYSADGNSWNTLGQAEYDQNKLTNPTSGFYQVFTHQKECDVRDSFGPVQLKVNVSPKPNLGNDTILYNTDTLWLTPGDFSSYKWIIGNKDTSHFAVSGYKYRNFEKFYFYCDVTATNGCTSRDSILIYFHNWTAGVADPKPLAFKVYPNPVEDKLILKLPESRRSDVQLKLMDLSGKVYDEQTIPTSVVNHEVNTSQLTAGVYLLSIQLEGETRTVKLVRE